MNILQITNTACTDSNQSTGVNRMVTQLSNCLANDYGNVFFHAFLVEGQCEVTPLFKQTFHITNPFDTAGFKDFLVQNSIDVVLFNFAGDSMLDFLPDICFVSHELKINVIYCFHFMPGYEGCSHGSFEEVRYSIHARQGFQDKFKKMVITLTRPLSSRFIQFALKKKYDVPYRNCDHIVVFTDKYIDRYLDIVRDDNRFKFSAIPNPLSFDGKLGADELQDKQKEVIYVGRLVEAQKKVSYILKIWKQIEKNPLLRDWKLSVVGDGKDELFYRWLTRKYNLQNVSFEGRQDPRPYYKRASIMMSTSSYEGWPMVMMEAMPMGCCVVAFDTYDAIRDIVEDGYNGFVVPDNAIKAYAECLTELMLNAEKRHAVGVHAMETCQRFSMDTIAGKWQSLFLKMCQTE